MKVVRESKISVTFFSPLQTKHWKKIKCSFVTEYEYV